MEVSANSKDNTMLVQLIQVVIGKRQQLTRGLSGEEWLQLFDVAMKQSVSGICCAAFERLPKEQKPPMQLFYQWIGIATQIQQQNELMDKRSAQVWRNLKEAGLDAAVLKGQGIATEYGELSNLRQSGDIDVWVLGGYNKVCSYVQSIAPTTDVAYHRFHFDVFRDTEVELHHRPTLMRNLFDDRKLAKWYNSFEANSFRYLEDKGFSVPSAEFNRIFILTHIYRHFLFEGIGLRQVMDFYFVLLNSEGSNQELSLLKEFRLLRFARAMMWLLHTQFRLEKEKLMGCGMDEKEGRFVLSEIMQTGNFGQADQRYRYKHLLKLRRQMKHGSHLLTHYPSEVLWTPIWLVYHWFWKRNKKTQIKKS